MKNRFIKYFLSLFFVIGWSCSGDDPSPVTPPVVNESQTLTIFHINDQHGRLENFAKIKYLVDEEKKLNPVLLVCSGDMFSGNAVVDNHEDKGYPMIDIMNKLGFDVAAIGNHEFDYGETVLEKRFEQANFNLICANVDMGTSGIPEPPEFTTITKNGLKITFLGLVETNGKDGATIPSTHPWRVQNFSFQKYTDVIANYSNLKSSEGADLYIALTHLGESTDFYIASNYPYFDLIIGGHSHSASKAVVNNTPVIQAGSNLNYLGKIKMEIKDKSILNFEHTLIDLNNYNNSDSNIEQLVKEYNELANLDEVIGNSAGLHTRAQVGCFYTNVIRTAMHTDISFQNPGGVRNSLDAGPITKKDIYSIDPFNNGSVIYSMTVGALKVFLRETRASIYYSGINIEQHDSQIEIRNQDGQELQDSVVLTIGINDYIPAVYDMYFSNPDIQPLTTAETIIKYLKDNPEDINYLGSQCYFKYD